MFNLVQAGEGVCVNLNTLRYATFDDDGPLLRLYFIGDEDSEVVLAGSKAESLWAILEEGAS